MWFCFSYVPSYSYSYSIVVLLAERKGLKCVPVWHLSDIYLHISDIIQFIVVVALTVTERP